MVESRKSDQILILIEPKTYDVQPKIGLGGCSSKSELYPRFIYCAKIDNIQPTEYMYRAQ